LVAATTKGLYLKPPGAAWTKIASFVPSIAVQPMDVVLTRQPTLKVSPSPLHRAR